MPIKNGVQVLKYVKADEELSFIPVIIYSTSHYLKDIDNCYNAGASYYLVKPTSVHTLVSLLKEMFETLEQDPCAIPPKDKYVMLEYLFK